MTIEELEELKKELTKEEFCSRYEITEDQFYGKEIIKSFSISYNARYIPEGFNLHINRFLEFLHVISLPIGFSPIVHSNLYLQSLEYLPRGFNPKVDSKIYLNSLKSKTLKDLIFYPGASRELGFNLLKNLTQ